MRDELPRAIGSLHAVQACRADLDRAYRSRKPLASRFNPCLDAVTSRAAASPRPRSPVRLHSHRRRSRPCSIALASYAHRSSRERAGGMTIWPFFTRFAAGEPDCFRASDTICGDGIRPLAPEALSMKMRMSSISFVDTLRRLRRPRPAGLWRNPEISRTASSSSCTRRTR